MVHNAKLLYNSLIFKVVFYGCCACTSPTHRNNLLQLCLAYLLPLAPLNVSSPPSNNAWIAVVSCSEYFNANRFFLQTATLCPGQDHIFE